MNVQTNIQRQNKLIKDYEGLNSDYDKIIERQKIKIAQRGTQIKELNKKEQQLQQAYEAAKKARKKAEIQNQTEIATMQNAIQKKQENKDRLFDALLELAQQNTNL